MPPTPPDTKAFVEGRHPEWSLHHVRWRWLLDSYEGGQAYRNAVYGYDTYKFPVRNLLRHKREYPDRRELESNAYLYPGDVGPPGSDPATAATDSDYTLRLARTPVPSILAEVVETHLSRIFAGEVDRDAGSPALKAWWDDVDGLGTPVDAWVADTLAPLLFVLGCVDVVCDHPRAPDGVAIETKADQEEHRLGDCVVGVILPENMVNWRADKLGYTECVVCELQDDGSHFYRHWDGEGWTLYGKGGEVKARGDHPFGRPPIRRLFDRKRPRCKNVGLPRYEGIAEEMREYYNRDSELILSDTLQAHPLLQGPEDYVQEDGTVQIGPSWLLPKKKNTQGGTATYEGFDVVEFPKDGAESLRKNLQMIRDRVDRAALLTKPAGSAGTDGNSVSQSGVSKRLDHTSGNDLLTKIAAVLQRAELAVLELAATVLGDGAPDEAALKASVVNYPRSFDLMTADEAADAIAGYQSILADAGACPLAEGELISWLFRLTRPGLDDAVYEEVDDEHEAYLESRASAHEAALAAAAEAPEGGHPLGDGWEEEPDDAGPPGADSTGAGAGGPA